MNTFMTHAVFSIFTTLATYYTAVGLFNKKEEKEKEEKEKVSGIIMWLLPYSNGYKIYSYVSTDFDGESSEEMKKNISKSFINIDPDNLIQLKRIPFQKHFYNDNTKILKAIKIEVIKYSLTIKFINSSVIPLSEYFNKNQTKIIQHIFEDKDTRTYEIKIGAQQHKHHETQYHSYFHIEKIIPSEIKEIIVKHQQTKLGMVRRDIRKECGICCEEKKLISFLHNNTACSWCCKECAAKYLLTSSSCPCCRQPIERVVEIFNH